MILIARMAIDKNMDYETLKYCDSMYGCEDLTDEVYEYVIEARDNGYIWFRKEYEEFLK